MNKKNIITFPLKFSLDLKRESLIFLKEKEYHFSFFNEKHKKIKKTLITTPWEKVSERKKNYFYLTRQYCKFLSILTPILNNFNKTYHNKRYWEQIIGIWLLEFLISVYERYVIVKKLKNDRKFTAYSIYNKSNIIPKNSREAKKMFISDLWSHLVFIELIQSYKKRIKIKYVKNNLLAKNSFNKNLREKFNYKTFIINFFSKVSNFFFKNEKIFVINSYLTFLQELLLQIYLNKSVKINQPLDKYYVFKTNPNIKKRKSIIKISKEDDDFVKFVKKIILKNIPLAFLEEYGEINKFNKKKYLNKIPKIIFTSNSNFYDDIFKIWLAEKKENGTKLILGQHGSQFILKYCTYDFYAIRTSDKILTWGSKIGNGKNFLSFGNLKTISKKIKVKRKKFISIMQDMPTKSNIRLWPGLDLCDYKNYISLQNKFLKKLNNENYRKIKIRLGSNLRQTSTNNLLDFEKKTWLKNHPNLRYETREANIYSSLENSYLTIITSVTSTLLLECINFNIPFLILTPKYDHILQSKVTKDFNKLRKNKILYTCPKAISSFLNLNDSTKIYNWWYSKKNQIIINEFQKKYSNSNKKSLLELSKILNYRNNSEIKKG